MRSSHSPTWLLAFFLFGSTGPAFCQSDEHAGIPESASSILTDVRKLAHLRGSTQFSRVLLDIEQTKYDLSTTSVGEIELEADEAQATDWLDALREKASWLGIKIECNTELAERPAGDIANGGSLLKCLEQFATTHDLSAEVGPDVVYLAATRPPRLYSAVFRVPTDFLENQRRPGGQENLPADPFAPQVNDGPNGLIAEDARQLLESWGVIFNEGAQAWFAPHESRLVVHNTPAQLKTTEIAVNSINAGISKQIRIQTDLFALPVLKALELKDKYRGLSDHREMVKEIYELMADDANVTVVGSVSIISRSGQRAKTEAHKLKTVVVDYTVKDGLEKAVIETYNLGHVLEVDPVIGADGVTIDLNLSPMFLIGDAKFTPREVIGPVSNKPLEVIDVDFPQARFTTSATIQSGQTLFLASAAENLEAGPRVLLCFVSADVLLATR